MFENNVIFGILNGGMKNSNLVKCYTGHPPFIVVT